MKSMLAKRAVKVAVELAAAYAIIKVVDLINKKSSERSGKHRLPDPLGVLLLGAWGLKDLTKSAASAVLRRW